jgi:hypothetical protein
MDEMFDELMRGKEKPATTGQAKPSRKTFVHGRNRG